LHSASVSFIFTALTAAVYVWSSKRDLRRINRTQAKAILYISLAGVIFAEVMFFLGLSITQALNVIVIAHLQPIFIILITFVILKEERLSRWDYRGGLFMLLSALLVSSRNPENLLGLRLGTMGEVAILLGTIAWASTGVVAKRYLQEVDSE
jgi:drug/metabolite transporter (DMT)-like permease